MNVAHKRNRRGGFSLIELLVVLAILGLLASFVGPRVMKFFSSSKTKTAKVQVESLAGTLEAYALDNGRYPSTDEGLQALVQQPDGAGNWNGPYLRKDKLPKDPWGNDYQYRSPGEHGPYDVWSYGAANAEGGDSENQDVVSWE